MASYVEIILREEVLFDDFLRWISGRCISDEDSAQWKIQCSRCEFALCFLNFLRDQTSRILSNDGKKTVKSSQSPLEKSAPREETGRRKDGSLGTASIGRKSVCSPEKSACDSTSDELSPSHVKCKVKDSSRTSRDSVMNSSFDSPVVTYSHHFHQRKSSPKQVQHFDSSPIREYKSQLDSSSEKSQSKSPREPWNGKNTQGATLWDYVSKDNTLGARKKNGVENGGKDDKNQDRKFGCKVNTRQKRQRRINPTRVVTNVETSESEGLGTSQKERQQFGLPQEVPTPAAAFSFEAKESSESNSSGFAEERALLREERMKMLSSDHDQTTSSPPKTSYALRNQSMEPILNLVTYRKELDILAAIFTILINKNLVPNVLSELCFLCNLLTVEAYETLSVESSNGNMKRKSPEYFHAVHNCAYFAVEVLSKLRPLLRLLDRNTQRMLSENSRVARFSPSLAAFLSSDSRVPRRNILLPRNSSNSSALTSFQTDVDNRKNFPNDRTFRLFCRQRDEFCEALRTWETGRSMPGWSFSVVLGPRIRSILTPSHSTPEPTNFIHLARFFRAQLLANCGNNCVTGLEESSNSGEVVPMALRDADPSKLQRLQRRLIWPSRSRGGCCPVPTFPGTQEFFRDFIVYGANHMFNEHLKDGLVSDILNLNDSQFMASELEDQDKVDDDTRCEYIKCVLNMQLLAKFLGFLVFLPYQSESRLPENIMLSYCTLRNKVMPVMDLMGLLWTAKQQRHLSITIPWIVVFLSMIDRVTTCTDYYKEKFFPLLTSVYRDVVSGNEPAPLSHAMLLVRLCLGWLFEQPNFPQEIVFREKPASVESGCVYVDYSSGGMTSSKLKGPDDLDLIDEFAVYTICPFLSELRMVMSDSSGGRSGSGTNIVRHITPVSTSDKVLAVSSSKLLELHLEESFFSNQPASMRRTVDFVSERVASTCVRHICNQLLPKAMKRGLSRVHNSACSKLKENDSDNSPEEGQIAEKFELIMAREIQEVSSEEWSNLKKESLEYSDHECERRAWDALPSLLPHSGDEAVSQAVCQMCVQVTIRISRQKVRRWIHTHTSAALFAKEFEAEVSKLVTSSQKPMEIKTVEEIDELPSIIPSDSQEGDNCLPASQLISQLRDTILDIMNAEQGSRIEMRVVQNLLEVIDISISGGINFAPPSLRTVFSMTVDLAIFIVAWGAKIVGKASSTSWDWSIFIPLWTKLATSSDDAFSRILSPRNLYLLSLVEDGNHGAGGKSTWASRLSSLLSALLSAKLMNLKQLEEQSLVILHTAWPEEFLAQYSECIKGVLDHPEIRLCSDDDDDVNTSALMMEWLAESCATMELLE
ncbi:codanin-1 [Ischnura elegans]|uniref:codanin-1 n=1 Tax=Ischnura elegans TaxID=197161 RepID=UPI001ED8A030|nr:codanin-1 [Ischnura elegans]